MMRQFWQFRGLLAGLGESFECLPLRSPPCLQIMYWPLPPKMKEAEDPETPISETLTRCSDALQVCLVA